MELINIMLGAFEPIMFICGLSYYFIYGRMRHQSIALDATIIEVIRRVDLQKLLPLSQEALNYFPAPYMAQLSFTDLAGTARTELVPLRSYDIMLLAKLRFSFSMQPFSLEDLRKQLKNVPVTAYYDEEEPQDIKLSSYFVVRQYCIPVILLILPPLFALIPRPVLEAMM